MTTNNVSSSSSGGIGFVGTLTVAFIVLKLTHVIAWSWWWVLSPIWITFGIVVLIMFAVGIFDYKLNQKEAREREALIQARKNRGR